MQGRNLFRSPKVHSKKLTTDVLEGLLLVNKINIGFRKSSRFYNHFRTDGLTKVYLIRLLAGGTRCFARDPLVKIQEDFKFEES